MRDYLQRTPLFHGWYVVGAVFILLFAGFGTAYSFGVFFLTLSASFEASRAAVSAVFSYTVFLIFTTGAISGALADRVGPRRVVAAGVFAIVAGLGASAMARSITQVTWSFALGVGCGVGFVYVPAIGAVQRWFNRRRGFASGIAVMGIGLGTLLMPLLAGLLLAYLSWQQVFMAMAAVVAVLGALAVLVIEADPAARGLAPDGEPTTGPPTQSSSHDSSLATILRSRPFVLLYLSQAVLSIAIFIPFAHLVPFAEDLGIDRAKAVTALGLIGLGSTVGRFLIGGLADRLGRGRVLTVLLFGLAVSYGIWLQAAAAGSLALFAVWFGVCYGGYVALTPALLADYFAGPRLSSVIGLQYTASGLGSLLGPIVAGYLFDVTGKYTLALVAGAACSTIAAITVAQLPKPIQTAISLETKA